jgi:hypothetical protein
MQAILIPEESFSDKRIDQVQSPTLKETQILRSPKGVAVARTFALEVSNAADTPVYSEYERQRIIKQVRLVLQDFYVHLQMKEAQYGYDAVRALDRLEPVVADLSDEDFHQSLIQLITRTRDRHLAFYGRTPNGISAVLPFHIECCWIDNRESYVVTKIRDDYTPKHLKPGALVTHWNGTPIARQIRLCANLFDGGNEAASIARSLEFLTQRPLSRFAWPIESWVVLGFVVEDKHYEERFNWEGFDVGAVPDTSSIGRSVIGFGGDFALFQNQLVKRAEFARYTFDEPEDIDAAAVSDGTPVIIGRKNNFAYGYVTTQPGTFAYMRLYHFNADNVDDIAIDMIDVFGQLPRVGLIIDMRGNSGGYIAAGERLLQLLTPREIVPTRFQFRVTSGTSRMMAATPFFDRWKQSFDAAQLTGEPFSQGYPIEGSDEDANQLGQHYFGPIVVVTDALAFSTADMFAAGFIDHAIGKVICIDKNMAAAGGNNWRFDVLRLFIPAFTLDVTLRADLDNGVVTDELRSAFNRNGVSLTSGAINSGPNSEFSGTIWRITDREIQHEIRHVPWMNDKLNVYPADGASRLQKLPGGVSFGFTVRRCIRTGPNEGRLLEDLGIRPDIDYKPTLRDVLEHNQDLITRAALELSRMPAYDLIVETTTSGSGTCMTCRVTNMTDLEVYCDGKHFRSFTVTSSPIEFTVPAGRTKLVLKGFHNEMLVAKRIISLNS